MSKSVLVVQRRLTHYRVRLFETLREELARRNIRMALVHGQPTESEQVRSDDGELPWAKNVSNRYISVGGRVICWQPLWKHIRDVDLVVLVQENSLLANYWVQLLRGISGRKVAFWGHGRNFQARNPHGLAESWKRLWLRRVDWWFAYTQVTVDHLVDAGYCRERITCLNNAIDTNQFRNEVSMVSREQVVALRKEWGIPPKAPIGVFCGSLYAGKRIRWLIDAAEQVRLQIPDFNLAIIGNGPEMMAIRDLAQVRPWIHITGALRGREKAVWYSSARLILNPSLVGLGVLDAFAAGIPIVTIDTETHGPEIAYLRHEENGMVTEDSVESYTEAVIRLLKDEVECRRLGGEALRDAQRYTMEGMAARFATGIAQALESG